MSKIIADGCLALSHIIANIFLAFVINRFVAKKV